MPAAHETLLEGTLMTEVQRYQAYITPWTCCLKITGVQRPFSVQVEQSLTQETATMMFPTDMSLQTVSHHSAGTSPFICPYTNNMFC